MESYLFHLGRSPPVQGSRTFLDCFFFDGGTTYEELEFKLSLFINKKMVLNTVLVARLLAVKCLFMSWLLSCSQNAVFSFRLWFC